MVWKPSVTVAAIAERDGRLLFIEEDSHGKLVLNQPAGHWEPGETLAEACARETLEESGYQFEPTALVGVYRWHLPYAPDAPEGVTFLRFTYAGDIIGHEADRTLDKEIVRALWLTPAELRAQSARHRSPLVQLCVDDYLAGRRYPLELVTHCE